MGKSPGRWIKSVLFGKKSSKSSLSKGRENLDKRSANAEDTLVSAKLPASAVTAVPPLTSHLLTGASAGNGAAIPSGNQDGDAQTVIYLGSPNHPETIKHEQAVTKVQAVCRGYLARRAFGALKGIIRLQALVRGHLVRRQAVATLCCVLGIVKFQALVRGQKVRCSGIASEVHEKQSLRINLEGKSSNSFGTFSFARGDKLSKNAFVCKLLASSPTVMPLCLQYGTGESNSAWEWLENWTRSHFWEPLSQQKMIFDLKPQVKPGSAKTRDTEQVRAKRGVQRLSTANDENGSTHSTSKSEKFKRNLRKGSSYSTESSRERPRSEIAKVKRNLKKISKTTMDASDRLETVSEKPKRTQKKASSFVSEVSNQGIADSAGKIKKDGAMTKPKHFDAGAEKAKEDMGITESKHIDVEDSLGPPVVAEQVDQSYDDPAADFQPIVSNGKNKDIHRIVEGLSCKDDQISDESQKISRRIVSLPAKQDDQENGLHNTPIVPSYMAATESVKAKLRMLGSPNFEDDGVEMNGFTRRHSLPSFTNGKLVSLSPRVQKLVEASGKGGIRSDKSLSTSRDGNDKVIQPGWRR